MFKAIVFGLGFIATKIQLPIISTHPEIKIVGFYEPIDDTAHRVSNIFNLGKRIYHLEEINDLNADIAFVFSPKQTHYSIIKNLLQKSKISIFTEKPLTSEVDNSKEIVDLVTKLNRIVLVNLNRRYAPIYKKAKEIFLQNPPDVCIAQKNRCNTEYRATLENAIHMIDLLLWFCGEPIEINVFSKFVDPYYENSVISMIKFKNSSLGVLIANRSAGEWMETFESYGNHTTININSPEQVSITSGGKTEVFKQTPKNLGLADAKTRLGYEASIEHFIYCVKNKREPLTNVKEAYKAELVLNEILKKSGLPLKDKEERK